MIEDDEEVASWIVLSSNPSHQVQAFGTKTGRTFKSEKAAKRHANRMGREYPYLDFLVLPVTPSPEEIAASAQRRAQQRH